MKTDEEFIHNLVETDGGIDTIVESIRRQTKLLLLHVANNQERRPSLFSKDKGLEAILKAKLQETFDEAVSKGLTDAKWAALMTKHPSKDK